MGGYSAEKAELLLSYELSGIADTDVFFDAAVAVLDAVFHCDGVAWNHIDLVQERAVVRGTPAELEQEATTTLLARHASDHPIIQSYLTSPSASPRRMSDLATHAQLLRSGSYTAGLKAAHERSGRPRHDA